jgi:hypothetical protein
MHRIHTNFISGNQCDQRFSILTNEFASEITTIEDLKEKITKAPMIPKAICRSLLYIFSWKCFIINQLSDPPLENHSKYNSFLILMEDGKAKLRAKKLPQDTQLVPRAGIRLLKEGHGYGPVGPAEFRIEKLNFDKIMRGLNIYLSKLPMEGRMRIQTSWDNLRATLEGLPKRSVNMEKMDLTEFPRLTEEVPSLPEHLCVVDETPQLTGDLFPEEINFGHLEDEVALGMDVCIYTEDKRWRPWLGRIVKILENKQFVLQWYCRKSVRSSVFTALQNKDGSPSLAELDNDTVMFWMISEPQSRTVNTFSLSPYCLKTIEREYEEMDRK